MTLAEVLQTNQKVWNAKPGASEEALDALRMGIRVELPEEYLEFLSFCNGGDGWTEGEQDYFILYPAEAVLYFNTNPDYAIEEFYPGYFIFGSDGSNGKLAFKTTLLKPWKVHLFDSYEPA